MISLLAGLWTPTTAALHWESPRFGGLNGSLKFRSGPGRLKHRSRSIRGTLAAMTSTFFKIAAAAIAIPMCAGIVSAEPRRGGKLLPPVSPACISSPFGPRVLPNQPEAGSYHYGIDLPAPVGAPIIAAAPGTVIRLQNKGPGGLEMLVQHDGFVGIYSHFGMVSPVFAEGKRTIVAGEQLGVVGITGVTSGAHLYFEMDLAGKPVDPAPYIGVPDCDGGVRRTLSRTLDADGKPRQYYEYQPALQYYQPARQYYDWQRH